MHCGLRPAGVTEAQCLQYASRMAFEWVLDSDVDAAHSLGLRCYGQWCGSGYAPESLAWWAINKDWPKYAALDAAGNKFQHHTPYWLCLQYPDARAAGIADLDNRIIRWTDIDGVFFDSASLLNDTKTGNPVLCMSPAHVHDCADFLTAKAKWLSEVKTLLHRRGKPVIYNVWAGRDWAGRFLARSDFPAFDPGVLFVESGPLAWSKIFDLVNGDQLVFQARDRQSVSLGHTASDYLECAGTIASHGAWFAYQNYYSEPADPPVFANCTAEINLLRTLPNWENLNGAVSRRWYYPRNLAKDAVASSGLSVYGNRVPSKAIDRICGDNLDDGWTGRGTQGTLDLSFETPVTVQCVRVSFGSKYTLGTSYRIYGFSSGSWQTLVSVSNNNQISQLHDLGKAHTISKLRYACQKSAHSSNVYLQEIEVYPDNPLTMQEYRSEFTLASKAMVYSMHPYTGEAFVVFNDPYATFDMHRSIGRIRKATNVWTDNGDGSSAVIIRGTSVRPNLVGTTPSAVVGSAFMISFTPIRRRVVSDEAQVKSQFVAGGLDVGSMVVKTVERSAEGWVAPSHTATTEIGMKTMRTVSAVRLIFPNRDKRGIDYELEAWDGQRWLTVRRVFGNNRDSRLHVLKSPVNCMRMRYVCKHSADPNNVYLKDIELLDELE